MVELKIKNGDIFNVQLRPDNLSSNVPLFNDEIMDINDRIGLYSSRFIIDSLFMILILMVHYRLVRRLRLRLRRCRLVLVRLHEVAMVVRLRQNRILVLGCFQVRKDLVPPDCYLAVVVPPDSVIELGFRLLSSFGWLSRLVQCLAAAAQYLAVLRLLHLP